MTQDSQDQFRDRRDAQPPPSSFDVRNLPPAQTARQVAMATLLAAATSNDFVTDHLERAFARTGIPSIERRLATELTFGVVRRKATLDAVLEQSVTRPRHSVEPALWMLLRLGTYQLTLCNGIPPHAACDETVELARWLGRPEWVPFANGVLRGISRLTVTDSAFEPATNSLPTTSERFRRLNQSLFADPIEKPLVYLSKAFSLPMWMLERWSKRFDFAELCRLGFWYNTPSPICLRINRLRTDRETLLAKFAEHDIAARPGELPTSIWLEAPDDSEDAAENTTGNAIGILAVAVGETAAIDDDANDSPNPSLANDQNPAGTKSQRIDKLPGFHEGWFVVQDESAQQVAELLAPQPGETILDLCSAPGTKTTHLAELMHNEGRIIATDSSESRLRLVNENCRRLGITIVETVVVSQEGTDIPDGPFDAILIDAPCSNTGVLGKRPDARWRIQPDDLEELSRIQLRLLLAAVKRLKPGGRIVYSTCSIEPEENTEVVTAASHFSTKLQIETTRELIPGRSADGGFQCLLRPI